MPPVGSIGSVTDMPLYTCYVHNGRDWDGTHRLPLRSALDQAIKADEHGLLVVVLPDNYPGTTEFLDTFPQILFDETGGPDGPEVPDSAFGYTPGEDARPQRGAFPGEMYTA